MFTLRPYQQAAIDALYTYFAHHKNGNPLISVPTAGGKSAIQGGFIKSIYEKFPQHNQRVMLLTHVKELIVQNAEKVSAFWPDAPVGIYSAGLNRRDTMFPITVAGVQSVYKKAHEFGFINIVMIDEAHLLSPEDDTMYRRLITELKTYNPKLKIIGMTATPFRTKGGMLTYGEKRIFTDIAYEIKIEYLLGANKEGPNGEGIQYIVPLRSKSSIVQADFSGVRKNSDGEFSQAQAEAAVDVASLTERALNEVFSFSENRKSWLVFCQGVKHAFHVCDAIRARGVSCEVITGETDKFERDRIIKDFRDGRLQCVTNYGVLTTGFDAPNVDNLILLRGTQSTSLFCLSEETEILTKSGFKSFDDIDKNELVAAPNMKTQKIEWLPIKGFIKRKLNENEYMVQYSSPHLSINVSNKHDMFISSPGNTKYSPYKKIKAEELISRVSEFRIPVAVKSDNPDLPINDDEIRFIAWFLTDGTLSKHNNAIVITQSKRYPDHIDKIKKMLNGCNFKYGEYTKKASTHFGQGYQDLVIFSISKGTPRGSQKEKTGWSKLELFIDKNICEKLHEMSDRQFEIFAETLHLGDGCKQPKNAQWTQRSYHISSARLEFANNLQKMAITHGWMCNISKQNYNKNNLYIIRLKKQLYRHIGGQGYSDRATFQKNENYTKYVWCVENENGSLITRNNGKVSIVGNCQMLGRGMRMNGRTIEESIARGKTDCQVLDFCGNLERFGPINMIEIRNPKPKGGKVCPKCREINAPGIRLCVECGTELYDKNDPSFKKCPQCASFLPSAARRCNAIMYACEKCDEFQVEHPEEEMNFTIYCLKSEFDPSLHRCPMCNGQLTMVGDGSDEGSVVCGYEYPVAPPTHFATASTADIIASTTDEIPQLQFVKKIEYSLHHKAGKPPSLKVTYHCGFIDIYYEWVNLGADGYARISAEKWWNQHRMYKAPTKVPADAYEAMTRVHELREPEEINVKRDGKYWRILNIVRWKPDNPNYDPVTSNPMAMAAAAQPTWHAPEPPEHDDIPF